MPETTEAQKPIGELLHAEGLVSRGDLDNALRLQARRGDKIGKILVDLGYVSERDMSLLLSRQLEVPIYDGEYPPVPILPEMMTYRFLKTWSVLPVHSEGNVLSIVMVDPLDFETRSAIRGRTNMELQIYIGTESQVAEQIERLYGEIEADQNMIEALGEATSEDNVDQLRDLASEAPVIRMVNLIISRAVESRASDIHVEPFEKELHLRYRVDGVLHNVDPPPREMRAAIVSRIKLMAALNIAERRLPQDGRIRLKVLGKEIDLRVSTIPTMHGESVVMRILDKSDTSLMDLRLLGFPEDLFEAVCEMTSKPHGMFLVTGPTGSGKTTTLYSALNRINVPDRKIITIEDPVEYQIDGINQIQVSPQIGLTFSSGLRHIVRQDPDVILIGEIRDLETAEIAIRAALTGHLVFSTLHTNDAPGAITRLIDMGVEDYLLASSLIGVLAQRLVRVICSECRSPQVVRAESLEGRGLPVQNDQKSIEIFRGTECEACGFTGFSGRIGVFELLACDDEFREAITRSSDTNVLRDFARKAGMRSLQEEGWNKVLAGTTTPDELLRVTQEA